jgi:hypothetical protein
MVIPSKRAAKLDLIISWVVNHLRTLLSHSGFGCWAIWDKLLVSGFIFQMIGGTAWNPYVCGFKTPIVLISPLLWPIFQLYPPVNQPSNGKWMKMAHLLMIYLFKMLLFHSSVRLLEGESTWDRRLGM